jgi:hypothetical protein
MRVSFKALSVWATLFLLACLVVPGVGCSRSKYRLQADCEAYNTIAERNLDPRWSTADYNIDIDPRSRYFDPYDPDHSPMPLDDPASHEYMRLVNGTKGWKHWHDNGDRMELENPAWQEALAEYVETTEDGTVKLDIDSALRLAYVHSPLHQDQLETVYLSSLDVTAERFLLDTQFFGGYDARYAHNGSLIAPGLSFSTLLKRFVITPAVEADGVENNRLTVGRPFGAAPALQVRRRFATAGQLLVGFANSFVFEFTSGDTNLATSLANFSFIQPLLRGAGKDVALEQLTLEERQLLANLRAYSQFRQGFYTKVAIGDLGVSGPQRGVSSTNLQSFAGSGGVGGYLGLLQQVQEIQNGDDNLRLQIRTRDRLIALLKNEFTDLVQVDQFRQSVERRKSQLLLLRNSYALALDRYKTDTLGLPPDLSIDLDVSLIQQFQLVPREATLLQDSVVDLQLRIGTLPDAPPVAVIGQVLDDASQFVVPVRNLISGLRQDLERMDRLVPTRERTMTPTERADFQLHREQLVKTFIDVKQEIDGSIAGLDRLRAGLSEDTREETTNELVTWVQKFLQRVGRLALVPARARLEMVTVEAVDLGTDDAFRVALANRLDFMNGRAALVDRWRSIQINADALQSVVSVTSSGDLRTARNNPVSFRAPTGSLRLGLEFDAPFTRLLERNAYRESLIQYQQSRRDFIQSRDSLHLGLRALIRQLEQLRQNLEIQRGAVTISIRRVDQTQLLLNEPRPTPQPGVKPNINSSTARDLLDAQSSLLSTQNSLLGVWLNYYAARMRLYRELGIMMLDPEGQWIEYPIGESGGPPAGAPADLEEVPIPPVIPTGWIEVANYFEQQSDVPPAVMVAPAHYSSAVGPTRINRLPRLTRESDTN